MPVARPPLSTIVLTLALAAAAPAAAQAPAADPIGDLLEAGVPDPPPPAPAPPPRLTRPVHVEETGASHEAPASEADLAYDTRLKASSASAQGFQGPLGGGWTLASAEGELYAFELVDRNGAVEGAWRDLRRRGALDASGFVEQVERAGADVVLRFGQDGRVAVLRAGADGAWTGELTEAGRARPVSLRRRGP